MDAIEGLHFLHLMEYFEDLEKKWQARTIRRSLRDSSDPFSMPEQTFIKLFRLSKELVHDLIGQITTVLPRMERCTAIPAHIKVLAALQFFGQGGYQVNVGQNFHLAISQPAVSRCIKHVSAAIVNVMLAGWISFPKERQDISAAKRGFMTKLNFPGVVGAVDGTHVAIVAPPAEDEQYPGLLYYNRKGYYSLNVQIISDSDLVIRGLDARFPGSVHDSAVWLVSNIRGHMKASYQRGDKTTWLLGDSGYGIQPWLLTPIHEAEDGSPEAAYNAAHILARNVVERCIGVLKSRFRCLLKHRTLHYTVPAAGKIVYACAVLHNMAIRHNVPNPGEEEEQEQLQEAHPHQDGGAGDGDASDEDGGDRGDLAEGRVVRRRLVLNHFTL